MDARRRIKLSSCGLFLADVLRRPQALSSFTCVLEGVCVLLAPSLDAFEEELLRRLNSDRRNTNLDAQVRAVVVQERRLHVGVHNGWGWVDGPQVLVLEPGAPRGQEAGMGSSSPPTPTHTPSPSPGPALTLRGSVELRMVRHPAFSVVFQLEYVFSVPLATEGKMSSMTVQRTVFMQCVCWSVWSPFL
ncbi:nephrocystin-4-like [Brachyhypopomus gauderio]|uniref:nephrocystin-4-like n=1 Tax=Brachyhypopomus gauderio TaxID=698409 RepID=UPI00404301DE